MVEAGEGIEKGKRRSLAPCERGGKSRPYNLSSVLLSLSLLPSGLLDEKSWISVLLLLLAKGSHQNYHTIEDVIKGEFNSEMNDAKTFGDTADTFSIVILWVSWGCWIQKSSRIEIVGKQKEGIVMVAPKPMVSTEIKIHVD